MNLKKIGYGLFIALVAIIGYVTTSMAIDVNKLYSDKKAEKLTASKLIDKQYAILGDIAKVTGKRISSIVTLGSDDDNSTKKVGVDVNSSNLQAMNTKASTAIKKKKKKKKKPGKKPKNSKDKKVTK